MIVTTVCAARRRREGLLLSSIQKSANSIIVNLLLALRDSNFFCFDDRSSPSRLRRAAQTVVTIIKLTALMITNGAKEYIIASTQGHTFSFLNTSNEHYDDCNRILE
jgi:hypothetical protein